MKKVLRSVLLLVAGFLVGVLVLIVVFFVRSLPSSKGEKEFPALEAEVRIVRDTWGVPHISAWNELDLLFACGFAQAQERMWQMDLLRRTGLGRLSEVFGPRTLDQDKLLRILGLREAAERDYQQLSAEDKALLGAFGRGVNAWLNTRKLNWPPEFLVLRYRPEPWSLIDSLIIKELMALLLSADFPSEIVRARLIRKLGVTQALEILEDGVEAPVEPLGDIGRLAGLSFFMGSGGSNSWVLAGSRTESGLPLLANDPHLGISLPSIWFTLHLSCPSWSVIGATVPGLPFVVIGHNAMIAWGATNSFADVQDLYVERVSADKESYWTDQGWRPLRTQHEAIKVRGRLKPVELDVRWTSHGPLLGPSLVTEGEPLALRWTIHDGGRGVRAFYLLNKAKTWKEFRAAVALFDAPSLNLVYADVEGTVGFVLAGRLPLRRRDAAQFPYPGWKSEGEWQGFLDETDRPFLLNPPEGQIVTANDRAVPADVRHYLGCDWFAPYRSDRIRELLRQQEKHSIESMKAIQNDVRSKQAEQVLPLLKGFVTKGQAKDALDILASWNGEVKSGQASALYEVFMDVLQEEVLGDELGEDLEPFLVTSLRKRAGLAKILDDPASPWFDRKDTEKPESREDVLRSSLIRAYQWMEKRHGPAEDWSWSRMHALKLRHALGAFPLLWFLNKGAYPMDGDSFTVKATFGMAPGLYRTTHGPSCRLICDLSDWDKSLAVLASGQSGHFLSRHYDDQIPLWLNGQYHPLVFSEDGVKANAKQILVLRPIGQKRLR